jgi:predicted metalloendopeptidase
MLGQNSADVVAGGWQETHSIPEDRGLLGSFNEVSDNNKVRISSDGTDESILTNNSASCLR